MKNSVLSVDSETGVMDPFLTKFIEFFSSREFNFFTARIGLVDWWVIRFVRGGGGARASQELARLDR